MASNQYSRPTGDNGSQLEVKRSSSRSQETSIVLKLKETSPEGNQVLQSQCDDRVEKGEKLQGKAPSSGVLDWERLEKRKSDTKCTEPSGGTSASSSISNSSLKAGEPIAFSGTVQSITAPCRKQPSSHCAHLTSSHEGGFSEFERGKRKDTDDKVTSEKGTSFPESTKHRFSPTSKDKTSAQTDGVTTREEEVQASEYDFGQSFSRGDEKGNVNASMRNTRAWRISRRNTSHDASCTSMHSKEIPGTLSQHKCIDENVLSAKPLSGRAIDTSKSWNHETTEPSSVKGKHLSPNRQFSFSPQRIASSLSFMDTSTFPQTRSEDSDGFFSAETYSGVLHSCTRPIRLDPNTGSEMRRPSLDASQSTVFPNCDASCAFMYPNEKIQNTISRANAIGAFEQLDQERHPSPSSRFISGLRSLRRSLSFMEGSNVPQGSTSNSLKSGRLTFEVSDSLDNSSRNKASTATRATLFMIKGTKAHHSVDTAQPLTGNLNLTCKFESIEEKKHEASSKFEPTKISTPTFLNNNARGRMQVVCKNFCTTIEERMPRGYKYSKLASIEAKAKIIRAARLQEEKKREETKDEVVVLVSSLLNESEKYDDANKRLGRRDSQRQLTEIRAKLHFLGLFGFEHWTRENFLEWLSSPAWMEY